MRFYRILAYFDNDLNQFCSFLKGEYHERGIMLDLKVTGKGNDIEVIVNDKWKFIDFLDRFRECLEAAIVSRVRSLVDETTYWYHQNELLEERLNEFNKLITNKKDD